MLLLFFLRQNEMQHMSGTPFFTLLSFLTPYPESVRMDGVRRRQKQIFWHREVWPAEILRAGMASRNILMKKQYTLL